MVLGGILTGGFKTSFPNCLLIDAAGSCIVRLCWLHMDLAGASSMGFLEIFTQAIPHLLIKASWYVHRSVCVFFFFSLDVLLESLNHPVNTKGKWWEQGPLISREEHGECTSLSLHGSPTLPASSRLGECDIGLILLHLIMPNGVLYLLKWLYGFPPFCS